MKLTGHVLIIICMIGRNRGATENCIKGLSFALMAALQPIQRDWLEFEGVSDAVSQAKIRKTCFFA